MGIYISAKLIYGLPYSDLPEEILKIVDNMLDNGELDYASPYYDAPRNEWIVGVEIGAWKKGHYDLGYEILKMENYYITLLALEKIAQVVMLWRFTKRKTES